MHFWPIIRPEPTRRLSTDYWPRPEYAEHMAYRWMEAARYGDTNGYQTDGPREMWRWRDWVIDAFRRNMPYDEFTIEQLAGDLLANPTLDQEIATGFNRNHRTSGEGGIIPGRVSRRVRRRSRANDGQRLDGNHHGLRALPRPQVRSHFPEGFLPAVRLFQPCSLTRKGFAYNYGNEEPSIKAPLPEQKQKMSEFDTEIAALEKRYAVLQPALHKAQAKWDHGLAGSKPSDWTVTKGLVFRSDAKIGSPDVAAETGPAGLPGALTESIFSKSSATSRDSDIWTHSRFPPGSSQQRQGSDPFPSGRLFRGNGPQRLFNRR